MSELHLYSCWVNVLSYVSPLNISFLIKKLARKLISVFPKILNYSFKSSSNPIIDRRLGPSGRRTLSNKSLFIFRTGTQKKLLCQKGKDDCENIIMHLENPNKCLFIILNIGPEAMKMKYQCEFTVKENGLDRTETGAPTTLLPGMFKLFGRFVLSL